MNNFLCLVVGLNNILFQASIHLQHTNKIWHKDLTVRICTTLLISMTQNIEMN